MNVVAWHRKFHAGATLEMRTVLHGRRLLIDKVEIHDRVFYTKTIYAGREQDSGETERERESERGSALLEMRISVGNKIDC